MSYLLKRLFRRGPKTTLLKTREFDIDLEVEFTDKFGRIIPNVKVTRRNKNNSQQEKFSYNSTDDFVTSPEAALEYAFTSPENLHAIATAFGIWTIRDDPNYLKESGWGSYTYFEDAYRKILSRRSYQGDEQPDVPQAPGIIYEFDAEIRYLEFQYLRFLHKAGLFDLPNVNLHPDDVDRLVSCGWLTAEDFDFDLGRLMLARGAYNRVARQTGQPGIDGTKTSGPLPWSIRKNIAKPAKDILEYVAYLENSRYDLENETGEPPEGFEIFMERRCQINHVWIETRRRETGLFGLKEFGISDERALELIRTTDASYVLPDEYSRRNVYARLAPHKPSPSEKLDSRPLVQKVPEPRHELVVPDIYVTDPPYGDMDVDVAPVPLYVYEKERLLPLQDRKIARLPTRRSRNSRKGHPLAPVPPSPARPIITPKRLKGAKTGLRRRDTTLLGWNNGTSSHVFIKRVTDRELKRTAPATFEIPACKRPCPAPANRKTLRRHETTLIGFNTETQQPIFVGGHASTVATPQMEQSDDSEDEVTAMVIDVNHHLRVPLKKYKRRERDSTPKELDYERPLKRLRGDIDFSIPQPGPTPKGAEPVQHPLLVGGVCFSYEPEDVRQQREEQFRQREAADPLLYLNPRSRSGQMQPWFSDLDAKIEFVEMGPGIIMMESTGRIFEYSRAACMYKELMPLPEEEMPVPMPAPKKSRSKFPRLRLSKSTV